jgi:hypothetical protein
MVVQDIRISSSTEWWTPRAGSTRVAQGDDPVRAGGQPRVLLRAGELKAPDSRVGQEWAQLGADALQVRD